MSTIITPLPHPDEENADSPDINAAAQTEGPETKAASNAEAASASPAKPPITVPMADLAAQYAALKSEIDGAVVNALETGAFVLGTTPSANALVESLEQEIADLCGARHGIAVNSGTDALLISLMALGITAGDEVITPPFTFVATVETVALLGAKPVFADIDPVTFNIDPREIEKKITPRTKAILPVHLFGQLADMTGITRIAQKHGGIPIIGDAAQAIGSAHHGKPVGAWSDLTTLSFYPTKNLGAAGDGGMILTDDDAMNERLRMLRFHGSSASYTYRHVGLCSRLDGLQAAVLHVKLPHLPDWNEARRRNAAFYDSAFAGIACIVPPCRHAENVHTYHQYTLRVLNGRRDELRAYLAQRGIATGIFYPSPLHLQEAYAHFGDKPGDFPEAERACQEVLSLPIMPELTGEQRALVAEAVRAFCRSTG